MFNYLLDEDHDVNAVDPGNFYLQSILLLRTHTPAASKRTPLLHCANVLPLASNLRAKKAAGEVFNDMLQRMDALVAKGSNLNAQDFGTHLQLAYLLLAVLTFYK